MLKWLKKASEGAQRGNVRRTVSRLVEAANGVDRNLVASGGVPLASDTAQIVSIQKQLLTDMVGPLSPGQLRAEFLDPLEGDPTVSDGARMAVRHVFDTAAQRGG
jgi:hypothetical protein